MEHHLEKHLWIDVLTSHLRSGDSVEVAAKAANEALTAYKAAFPAG